MGTVVQGKEKRIFIDDGTGAMVEVPYQGDATFDNGRAAQISVTKNGKHPYGTDGGASIQFNIEKERPALAIHTRLRTLALAATVVDFEYRDVNTGGEKVSGSALVTIGSESSPVDGVISQQVTLSVVDDPVYGTV